MWERGSTAIAKMGIMRSEALGDGDVCMTIVGMGHVMVSKCSSVYAGDVTVSGKFCIRISYQRRQKRYEDQGTT